MVLPLARAAAADASLLERSFVDENPNIKWGPELTRTPRGLRWVRTGYAYQPPALGTYRTRRAACPQRHALYVRGTRTSLGRWGYVPRTVAPQEPAKLMMHWKPSAYELLAACERERAGAGGRVS